MRLTRKCRRHLNTFGQPKNNCLRCWNNYYFYLAPINKANKAIKVKPEERLLSYIFGDIIYG